MFGPGGVHDAAAVRRTIRAGGWTSHTSGLAPGYVQGNVVILPRVHAGDTMMNGFCSYSHRDRKYLDRLQVHLAQMEREGLIRSWCDRQIPAGEGIEPLIKAQLEQADLFLMLLSPDFIASPYCQGLEVKRAIERRAQGEAMVIPIILKPCDWKTTQLGDLTLKAAPDDGKPICKWRPQDEGWNNVVARIRLAISPRAPSPAHPAGSAPRCSRGSVRRSSPSG